MLFKNNYLHLILLIIISLLIIYETHHFIVSDEFLAQSLSDKYTQNVIKYTLNIRSTWLWIIYLSLYIGLCLL